MTRRKLGEGFTFVKNQKERQRREEHENNQGEDKGDRYRLLKDSSGRYCGEECECRSYEMWWVE